MERIVLASSNPGDLVADFFCGSGTLPLVASKNGRRFLAADSTWRAIHTTRSRLVYQGADPFSIYREKRLVHSPQQMNFSIELNHDSNELEIIHHQNTDLHLDYWEVDPDWDRTIFRSAFQVKRDLKSAQIPLKIKLPYAKKNICVRAVSAEGECIQLHV